MVLSGSYVLDDMVFNTQMIRDKAKMCLVDASSDNDANIPNDWRKEIIEYWLDPSNSNNQSIKVKSLQFLYEDEIIYKRTLEGILLRCLGPEKAGLAMDEVHEQDLRGTSFLLEYAMDDPSIWLLLAFNI